MVTDRTRLRRKPARGAHDTATIHAILDAAYVCHVAFVVPEHGPTVLPTSFVRDGEHLYVHGSAASHMMRAMASGIDVCVAVTLLDGIVLAKTALHHSVNYRSVVMFGRARAVEDAAEKQRIFGLLLDRFVANRSRDCRMPNPKEVAATLVIEVPLDEASAKTRSGPPVAEEGADAELPYWAGVIPFVTTRGEPIPA